MKKVYKLEDLDCVICAKRMEDEVKKLQGVNDCSVNYFTQKMTIDIDDNSFSIVMKKVIKTCKRAVPDCTVITND